MSYNQNEDKDKEKCKTIFELTSNYDLVWYWRNNSEI